MSCRYQSVESILINILNYSEGSDLTVKLTKAALTITLENCTQ